MRNYLRTESSPNLLWKPAEGKLKELMRKNKDEYDAKIKQVKEDAYNELAKKVYNQFKSNN